MAKYSHQPTNGRRAGKKKPGAGPGLGCYGGFSGWLLLVLAELDQRYRRKHTQLPGSRLLGGSLPLRALSACVH